MRNLEWTVDTRFSLVHHEHEPRVSFAFSMNIRRPDDIGDWTRLYTGPAIHEIELALLGRDARRVLREAMFGDAFPPANSRRVEFREPLSLAWPLLSQSSSQSNRGLPL